MENEHSQHVDQWQLHHWVTNSHTLRISCIWTVTHEVIGTCLLNDIAVAWYMSHCTVWWSIVLTNISILIDFFWIVIHECAVLSAPLQIHSWYVQSDGETPSCLYTVHVLTRAHFKCHFCCPCSDSCWQCQWNVQRIPGCCYEWQSAGWQLHSRCKWPGRMWCKYAQMF